MRPSCLVLPLFLMSFGLSGQAPTTPTAPAATPAVPSAVPVPGFTRDGRVRDPNWFPLAVWLQDPANATKYRELGVNLYVGLWDGPTKAQLDVLAAAGMPVICHHNDVGARHGGATIVAWMHNDEPDNAQGRRLRGYAPPIAPAKVVADYRALRESDATRPVFLNLGQGAAWDGWHGRGERSGHPEDYPEYLQGCDIGCFDIYPVTHPHREVQGKLEFVGRGVQRLRQWTLDQKPIWACIETGHVGNAKVRPTPDQVRDEAWLAIACGASGLVWFCHEFEPQFVEAGLLQHDDVAAAVRTLAAELRQLAPVLNSPQLPDRITVGEDAPAGAFALRVHEHDGHLHGFLAALRAEPANVPLQVATGGDGEVLRAGREPIPMRAGAFSLVVRGHGTTHFTIATAGTSAK